MRSQNVAAVIRLCGGKFEACEIYRRRIESEGREADGKEDAPENRLLSPSGKS
jgi:hypothetical protein